MKQKPRSIKAGRVDELAEPKGHSEKSNGASDRSLGRTASEQICGRPTVTPRQMECGGNSESAGCRVAYLRVGNWVGAAFEYVRERAAVGRFLCSGRAGATGIVAGAVAVMAVLGGALITDHVWLIDKRDLIKNAATAASLTATAELARLPDSMADEDVATHLRRTARNYAWINLSANTRSDLEPEDIVVQLDIKRTAGIVDATVEADVGDTLFSFLYPGPKTVRQTTAAENQYQPAEVVLAIDTSASMRFNLNNTRGGRSRLHIVREAANELIDALASNETGAVALGLVPWTEQVRLGRESRRQWHRDGWADFPARRSYVVPYRCQPQGRCVTDPVVQDIPRETRGTWHGCIDEYRILDGVAELPTMKNALELPSRTAFAESYFTPSAVSGGRAYQCLGEPMPANFDAQRCWVGASADGAQQSLTGQFPLTQPQRACNLVNPMVPLTTEMETVRRAVDALRVPGLSTYSALGIQWGRRMLSPSWREVWGAGTHPMDTDRDVPKIIVLLTDGEDNICGFGDRECESGLAVGRDQACEAAKAEGIEIFVVAAMSPRWVSRDLGAALRDCASSPDHAYINNPDAEALLDAFRDIGTKLLSLKRIS